MSDRPAGSDPGPGPGDVVGGHYRLGATLGKGAFGTVHRAVHTLDGREFAVKVLDPALVGDPTVRARFLREAAAVSLFAHENVATIRHYGEHGGTLYLVMDLCPGETLAARLAREGPLPTEEAAAIAIGILDALSAAHAAGIVHRDLKPSNVIVESPRNGRGPRVRVVDFGLAHLAGTLRDRWANPALPPEEHAVGTVAYMSPEQVRGDPDVDARSDLFSLGVVLHEMLSGRPPFLGDAPFSTMLRVLDAPPEPLPPLLPGPLRRVVGKALEKDRERRYGDAGEFSAAIVDAIGGRLAAERGRPPRRARRLLVAGGIAAVLLAVAFVLLARGRDRDPADVRARAVEDLVAGRFQSVLEALDPLAASAEGSGEDFLHLGITRTHMRDPRALVDLVEADRRLRGDARVPLALAWAHAVLASDLEEALRHLGRALETPRGEEDARTLRAYLVMQDWGTGRIPDDRLVVVRRDIEHLARTLPEDERTRFVRANLVHLRVEKGRAESTERATALADLDAAVAGPVPFPARSYLAATLRIRLSEQARAAGEVERERALLGEAVADLGRAVTSRPPPEGVGGWLFSRIDARRRRGLLLLSLGDRAAALADFRAAAAQTWDEVSATERMAFDLRTARLYEEAIPLLERLQSLKPAWANAKDVAWCRSRLAGASARAGDLDGARRLAIAALEDHDEAVEMAPSNATPLAYRLETLLLARRLDRTRADAHLARAREDAARADARVGPHEAERMEHLFRRAEFASEVGDVAGALAAMEAAVGGKHHWQPEVFERRGRCRLASAARLLAGGDPAASRARLAEAEADFRFAERVRPVPAPQPRAGLGWVFALGARAEPEASGDHLRRARDEWRAAAGRRATEEDAWVARVAALLAAYADLASDPRTPADAVERLHARLASDLASGRWWPSAAFYEALAAVLEARGLATDAAAARAQAKDPWS